MKKLQEISKGRRVKTLHIYKDGMLYAAIENKGDKPEEVLLGQLQVNDIKSLFGPANG
jgi:hypothetical protein